MSQKNIKDFRQNLAQLLKATKYVDTRSRTYFKNKILGRSRFNTLKEIEYVLRNINIIKIYLTKTNFNQVKTLIKQALEERFNKEFFALANLPSEEPIKKVQTHILNIFEYQEDFLGNKEEAIKKSSTNVKIISGNVYSIKTKPKRFDLSLSTIAQYKPDIKEHFLRYNEWGGVNKPTNFIEWEGLKMILNMNLPITEDVLKEVKNIIESDPTPYIYLLEPVGEIKKLKPSNKQYNPLTMKLQDNINSGAILSHFTTYEFNSKATSFENLFNSSYKFEPLPNSCVPSALIELFKNSFDKLKAQGRYTTIVLDYANIHYILRPNSKFDENNLSYTALELVNFYIKFNLNVYIFDDKMKLLYKYISETQNKKINPRTSYFMIKNKHLYILNDRLDELHQLRDIEKHENTQISNKYTLPKINDEKERDLQFFSTEEEIIKYIISMPEKTSVDIITNLDLNEILIKLVDFNNYICGIQMHKNALETIKLKGDGERYIYIKNDYKHNNKDEFLEFANSFKSAVKDIISPEYISYYNEQTMSFFNEYTRGGLFNSFYDEIYKDLYAFDFNKFYTSCLMELKYIPIFTRADNFIKYDGHQLEDYNIYQVSLINPSMSSLVYSDKSICLSYGFVLKQFDKEYNIISYIRPSHLSPNVAIEVVQNLYKNNKLSIADKKDIINIIIGKTGTKRNLRQESRVYLNKEEVEENIRLYGGYYYEYCKREYDEKYKQKQEVKEISDLDYGLEDIKISFDYKKDKISLNLYVSGVKILNCDELNKNKTEKVIVNDKSKTLFYVYYSSKKESLINGFFPIQLAIYDLARFKMYKLYNELQETGLNVIGVRCDCIYVKNDTELISKFKTTYPNYFAFTNKNDFNAIGKLKEETNSSFEYCNVISKTELENVFKPIEYNNTPITFDNEYDIAEIKKKLEGHNRILFKADCAGAGKTTTAFKVYGDKKILYIVENSNLLRKMKQKFTGFDYCTLSKILGLRVIQSETEEDTLIKKHNISDYDIIIIDEIFQNDINKLSMLWELMDKHNDKIFVGCGDSSQLKPIKVKLNNVDIKQYYNMYLGKMFNTQVLLKVDKRRKNKDDIEKFNALKNDILNTDISLYKIAKKYFKCINNMNQVDTLINIVARHSVADTVNNHIKNNVLKINDNYKEGMRLISKDRFIKKKIVINVNYEFTIKSIHKNIITLEDEIDEYTLDLTKEEVKKYFKYSWSYTGHAVQGDTFDEGQKTTVFLENTTFIDRNWFYVAISRNASLNDISIYTGSVVGTHMVNLMNVIRTKINNEKTIDIELGRYSKNYVSEYEIIDLMKKSNHTCYICKQSYNIDCINSFGIRRINNDNGLIKTNCGICCNKCNKI